MKVVFVADVHHAFGRLRDVLDQTNADLYLVTGDLAARAFYRYETAWQFMELQQVLRGVPIQDRNGPHPGPHRPEDR